MNTQYIDITWLSTFGLTSSNVLDYFYTSPFYDSASNNETFRRQGTPADVMVAHLTNGKTTGLEFALDTANTKEPHLFVIKKQNRHRSSVDLLEVYYCLDGIIYQSPILLDLLRNRIAKVALRLKRSFEELDIAVLENQKLGEVGESSLKFLRTNDDAGTVAEKSQDVSNSSDFKDLIEDISSISK